MGEELAGDIDHILVRVARLAPLDEVAVLGEAAGVDVERHLALAAQGGRGPHVLHRDRLTAAAVVGHGEHHEGHALLALQ